MVWCCLLYAVVIATTLLRSFILYYCGVVGVDYGQPMNQWIISISLTTFCCPSLNQNWMEPRPLLHALGGILFVMSERGCDPLDYVHVL